MRIVSAWFAVVHQARARLFAHITSVATALVWTLYLFKRVWMKLGLQRRWHAFRVRWIHQAQTHVSIFAHDSVCGWINRSVISHSSGTRAHLPTPCHYRSLNPDNCALLHGTAAGPRCRCPTCEALTPAVERRAHLTQLCGVQRFHVTLLS